MAQFLRAKQAGIQRDLSAGFDPQLFAVDLVARYGINSQISAIAYDPVQSLLAVGTSDTQYGSGQIYVFGQARVCVTLALPRKASVRLLQFCADKIVSVDSKDELAVYSLASTRILASYSPPSHITALLTDPALDYALLGLQNGEVVSYDMDREGVAPFRISNFWREQNPRARTPVVSLAFHPRDIGSLLIGYPEGGAIFTFQLNKVTKSFRYEVPAGAPGGDSDPALASRARAPRLTQAVWHPTGTFILTGHEDSSIVVWDPKDGRKILARTLETVRIDDPTSNSMQAKSSTFTVKEPLFKLAWCAKDNPDDTGLLIAGGAPTNIPDKGLTFMDLGPTPNYSTSSWQLLSDHFEKPKKKQVLPLPPYAEVVDFCLIPRRSPYFAGSQDPIALIALLSSGAIITLSFPSGHPITPTNQLHVSLSYVHPFANHISMTYVARTQWLGMTENRPRGPPILRGGAEQKRTLSGFANRNVMQTAHADGVVRIWDVGHGDEIENGAALQIDVACAVGRSADVDIAHISMSGATGELAVGLRTGEVAVFRWDRNQYFGREVRHEEAHSLGLEAIKDRSEAGLKEGLLPLSLFDEQQASVTALKTSDIGFVVAGFETGSLAVIDLRGPAVIYNGGMSDLTAKQGKRSSFRKSANQAQNAPEWPTCCEFGVLSLDGDDYSSICLFVGTNLGRLVTFKLLPEATGSYAVIFAGTTSVDDHIQSVSPINVGNGAPADANQSIVGNLRNGSQVNGTILVVTSIGARIFKPPAAKGASKSFDDYVCHSAATVRFGTSGYVLVGLFSDGCVKAFSIPGLKELTSRKISETLDVRRLSEAIITPTGEIIGWTGPSEIAVLNVWGNGEDFTRSLDKVFNPEALIPPRPTISNMQWLSGTSYVTPADMDKLIGGPDRPPSQRMIEQMNADEKAQRTAARQASSASSSSGAPPKSNEGYWAYMQRQVQERTENLGLTGESMNKLEDNSGGFADDVSKFVSQQKRKAVMGVIGSKFGL